MKDVSYNTDSATIIYPCNIRSVVSEILLHDNVNFGNKQEIMNLFSKAIQNGEDPVIVSSQIEFAANHCRRS